MFKFGDKHRIHLGTVAAQRYALYDNLGTSMVDRWHKNGE